MEYLFLPLPRYVTGSSDCTWSWMRPTGAIDWIMDLYGDLPAAADGSSTVAPAKGLTKPGE
eukprot:35626-Eustigmatos_ZCMA.PRE.1